MRTTKLRNSRKSSQIFKTDSIDNLHANSADTLASKMFNSLYPFKQQKRNFQEDSPHYVPSLKRTRLWQENLENGVQPNLHFDDSTHLIRNTSSNMRTINKPEYLPAVCIDVNDPFHNDMDLIKFKYMPDLNATQNPHYYEYNRLLFELYLERIRRCKSHNPSSLSPV